MTRRRMSRLAAVAALVATIAACSADDDSSPPSGPPVPTTPATISTAAPSSTAVTTSSAPATTTSELNPVPTTPAPPAPTTVVPIERPTIDTLVPQVPAELLTPEQLDPFNGNNTRPILPEHVPVIEAYLRVNDPVNMVASQAPIDPDAPELVGAPYMPEVLGRSKRTSQSGQRRGEVLDVSQGATPRPYVIGPVTDTAVIYDCYIDGTYWSGADGSAIAPTPIFPGTPGRVAEVGFRIDMVQRDGQWLFNSGQVDEEACA